MWELVVCVTVWHRGTGEAAAAGSCPPRAETRFLRPLSAFWTDAEMGFWIADVRLPIELWFQENRVDLRKDVVVVVYAVEETTFEQPPTVPAK